MEQLENNLLVIAALLHDVGKFAQRAGRPKSPELEGELCPIGSKNRRATHQHVLYTNYFIEDTSILPLPEELEGHRSRIARLAAAHHKPGESELLEKAISIADRLSAGGDRIDEQVENEGDYKTARLASVFDQVSLKSKQVEERRSYYPLIPMGRDVFPVTLAEAQKTDYSSLFTDFLDGLRGIPSNKGIAHYIASLTSVLEKFTWCIPSSTWKTRPDISLFDHAVTTAAIAQALHIYHKEEGGVPGEGISKPKVILLGGDLSGIQRYIFHLDNAHGSGVAKLFRARSFYLQLLSRSVSLALLHEFGMSPLARIMDAGGRFLMLLPATRRVRERLPEFEAEVQRWFFTTFRGELSLNLSFDLELSENDFQLEMFQKKLDAFNDHLELRKLQKYDKILADADMPVHNLRYDDYAASGECNVCKANPATPEAMRSFAREFQKEVTICDNCYQLIHHVGGQLPTADYVAIKSSGKGTDLFGGLRFSLHKSPPGDDCVEIINIRNHDAFTFLPIAGYLPRISREDMERWERRGESSSHEDGGTFYGEDLIEEGMPKTLNILAEEARIHDRNDGKPRGKAFLGAFKADVDNLGMLFSIGLKERLSISRFACMSRMLNTFFADYLVQRIRNDFPDMYVVFAGGDDIFLLGPWTQCLDFACMLDMTFRDFISHNPDITLSAGITLSKSGVPVRTMAHEAERLLDASKQREHGGRRVKDGVTIFDVTVGWKDFHTLLQKGAWLEKLLLEGKITQGLAYRLLRYGDDFRAFRSGDIKKGICISHMQYDFQRNVNDTGMTAEDRAEVFGVQQDEFLLYNLRLPVSYAFYRLRTN